MSTIAFIGLGIMGAPMARHLLDAGRTVIGVNRSSEAVRRFTEAGGLGAATVAEAVREADVIITMAGEFQPGFRVDLHHKDLGILTDAARAKSATIPLGALTAQLVGALRAQGDESLDHSALLRGVERLSGQAVSGG
jgi:3-hydroxyisobutyrate dehydrogenase-like beta-hydroxyacid dehydrogenase